MAGMSATVETPAPSGALEWKPLLFVRYREGKKTRTADLRGPEWHAAFSIAGLIGSEQRLWKELSVALGVRDGTPVWVRVVRDYNGRTGTGFIPWSEVLAVEYEGDEAPLGEGFIPPAQASS